MSLRRYFLKHASVARDAARIVEDLARQGLILSTVAIDIDACLPFMLEMPHAAQRELSVALRLAREAVTALSRGERVPAPLDKAFVSQPCSRLTPRLQLKEYGDFCAGTSRLRGGVRRSYLRATRRVYYRRQLLAGCCRRERLAEREAVLESVQSLSAFLLFDDDVVDLDDDILTSKDTILIAYLRQGGTLEGAVAQMLGLLSNRPVTHHHRPLVAFMSALRDVYAGRGAPERVEKGGAL